MLLKKAALLTAVLAGLALSSDTLHAASKYWDINELLLERAARRRPEIGAPPPQTGMRLLTGRQQHRWCGAAPRTLPSFLPEPTRPVRIP